EDLRRAPFLAPVLMLDERGVGVPALRGNQSRVQGDRVAQAALKVDAATETHLDVPAIAVAVRRARCPRDLIERRELDDLGVVNGEVVPHEPPIAAPVARPAVQVVAFRAGAAARRSGIVKGRARLPAERL